MTARATTPRVSQKAAKPDCAVRGRFICVVEMMYTAKKKMYEAWLRGGFGVDITVAYYRY